MLLIQCELLINCIVFILNHFHEWRQGEQGVACDLINLTQDNPVSSNPKNVVKPCYKQIAFTLEGWGKMNAAKLIGDILNDFEDRDLLASKRNRRIG